MKISDIPGITSPVAPITKKEVQEVAPQGQRQSFSEAFSNAIKEVDGLQREAENQVEGLVLKKEGVTPHGAMIALEKADVAFQLMNQIRNKIIRAYEEVLRTQV